MVYDDACLLPGSVKRRAGIACMSYVLASEALEQRELVLLPEYVRLPGQGWWMSRTECETRSPLVRELFDWLRAEAALVGM